MSAERPPAFQFYVRNYKADERVQLMTYEQRGIYIELLGQQWLEGSIPGNLKDLARLLKVPLRRLRSIWPLIERCFTRQENGRLINQKLDRHFKELDSYKAHQSQSGKVGAEKRWAAYRLATDSLLANDSSASASASADLEIPTTGDLVPRARSGRRPLADYAYCGSRLRVTKPQEAEVRRRVGKVADQIRLDEHYALWDAELVTSGEPFDTLGWLESRILQEAGIDRRRMNDRRDLPSGPYVPSYEETQDMLAEMKAKRERPQ